MEKKNKTLILLGALAAIVSAVVLLVMYWDKLLALCPFKSKKSYCEDFLSDEDMDMLDFDEEDMEDFADLSN